MHASQAERALLGAVLARSLPVSEIAGRVKPDDFQEVSYRIIYGAALEVGVDVDLVTVTDRLIRDGSLDRCGGPTEVSGLVDGLPLRFSDGQVSNYCEIIIENASRARVNALGHRLTEASGKDDHTPGELVAKTRDYIHRLEERSMERKLLTGAALAQIEERDLTRRLDPLRQGIDTGLPKLDHDLGQGLQPGSMWIVGARPRIGKSTLLTGIACHNVERGKRVLIVACEMGEARNARRILSVKSGVRLSRIASWHPMTTQDNSQYLSAFAWLEGAENLRFLYHPGITPSEVEAACLQARAVMGGLDLVVVDYFQLMGADTHYRQHHETRAECVRDVAKLAGRLNVPLVLGWQLNRDAEGLKREDMPSLKELADTQAAEQVATGVILLHRWGLYNENNEEAKILIAKNQDGAPADIAAIFNRKVPRWE